MKSLLSSVINHSSEIILIVNEIGEMVYANDKFYDELNIAKDDSAELQLKKLMPFLFDSKALDITAHRYHDTYVPVLDEAKNECYYHFRVQPLAKVDDENYFIFYLRADQDEVTIPAYDPITHLPNKTLFNDLVKYHIEYSKRYCTQFALFYIELNDFHALRFEHEEYIINDILRTISERIKLLLRDSDPVSRYQDEYFIALLNHIEDPQEASLVAEKLIAGITKPFMVDNQVFKIGVNIGVSLFPEHGTVFQELFDASKHAMRQAKKSQPSHVILNKKQN